MKTLILVIALIAGAAVRAEPWTIDDKTREECAKAGGCILTIPDGLLIPVEEVNKIMIDLQKRAFEAGVTAGSQAKVCPGKDV